MTKNFGYDFDKPQNCCKTVNISLNEESAAAVLLQDGIVISGLYCCRGSLLHQTPDGGSKYNKFINWSINEDHLREENKDTTFAMDASMATPTFGVFNRVHWFLIVQKDAVNWNVSWTCVFCFVF